MNRDVFLIAGEASGDALGASLIRALRKQAGETGVAVSGIGGPLMKAEGFETLLPMSELCVMGLWEVIGHLPRLLRLIDGVVEEIEKRQPAVLVTIDLPDFNFRVAEKLRKRKIFTGKIVHYVAPSVWAWRPGRAKKIAKFLDGLLCLFPFEPPYFEKEKLAAEFVGHPLVESALQETDRFAFRAERGIPDDALCVGILLGSRAGELEKHAKIMTATIDVLREQYPEMHIIAPTLPHLEFEVSKALENLGENVHISTDQTHKWQAFAACDMALAVSGTVGLELALMGVPHVIGYKMNILTWAMLRLMIKTRYAHLVNILLGRGVVPEFIQSKFTVLNLSRAIMLLIRDAGVREQQKKDFQGLETLLRAGDGAPPSEKAAAFVLKLMPDPERFD